MKKIVIIILFYLTASTVYSQTPYDDMVKCKTSIQARQDKEGEGLFDYYYYPNSNGAACQYTNHTCKAHKSFCCGTCWNNYQNKLNAISNKYKPLFDACDNAYNKAIAEQDAKAERERRVQEEKRQKEEKERIAKEEQTSALANNSTSRRSASTSNSYNNSYNTNAQRSQAIMDNLNRQLENNRNTYNAISNSIQQFGNLLLENQQRRQQEREEAQERRRQQEEEEELRRAEEAENNRRIEAAAKAERERQFEIDKNILGAVVQGKKPGELPDDVKQAYYIVYERNYTNGRINLKTYTLNKYSDGTWMLQSDMLKKIGFRDYFGNGGVGLLLGAYASRGVARTAFTNIMARAEGQNGIAKIAYDDSFLEINGAALQKAAGTDKDFWNN